MEKKFDRTHEGKYTGDGVIKRGYAIYDDWNSKKFTSRKIVGSVRHMVASVRKNGTNSVYIEALSYLFALDMRMKEKYNHFLLRLFLYFFWRNEMRALQLLKGVCHISDKHGDMRAAIEVELQKLRERMETEESEGKDNDVRGGKRNGKADEEAVAAEEKQQDQVKEETQKEIHKEASEKEETKELSEEKSEELTDQISNKEQKDEISEKQYLSREERENVECGGNDQEKQEESREKNKENNGLEEKSEPSTDKTKENKTYNDAVDAPPLYEATSRDKPAEKTSFIDEIILDHMIVKGKEDVGGKNSVQDVKQSMEDVRNQTGETATRQNMETKINSKESYLYDKMGATTPAEKGGASLKQTTAKASQVTAQTPSVNEIAEINDSFEDLSIPIQMDISLDQENAMRREISNNMTENMIIAIRDQMAAVMREQMEIASAELGIEGPVDVIGKTDAVDIKPMNAAPERK